MVLHAATHLFLNEEFSSALRDLADLDSLLRHFGGETRFWRTCRLARSSSSSPARCITRCVTQRPS